MQHLPASSGLSEKPHHFRCRFIENFTLCINSAVQEEDLQHKTDAACRLWKGSMKRGNPLKLHVHILRQRLGGDMLYKTLQFWDSQILNTCRAHGDYCQHLEPDSERLNVATAAIIYESRSEALHTHVKTHAASMGVTCWMPLRCLCFRLMHKQLLC